jgi:hypothetical protein
MMMRSALTVAVALAALIMGNGLVRASAAPVATSASLSGVSCKGNSFCLATGSHSEPGNGQARLVEEWNGGKWTDVPDSLSGDLTNVTCGSAAFCFADRGRGRSGGLAEWNGKTWARFTGLGASVISCGSPKACITVTGGSSNPNTDNPVIDQWNGKRWKIVPNSDACCHPPR